MKIIVLGASGQIGCAIYLGLSKKGHQVIGTSRKNTSPYLQFDPFHDEWSALGKTDVVINCVGQIEATRSYSFERIHVGITELIINNRAALGEPKIIQVSALGASVNHPVEFLRTKATADTLLLQQLNTLIIRPSIVCTHRTMIVKKMLMLSSIARYTGYVFLPKDFLNTRIQPIAPDDLVEIVNAACAADIRGTINVVGPETITFRELLTMLFEARHQKLRIREVSRSVLNILVTYFADVFIPGVINQQQYQLLFEDNIADTESITNILGRAPESTKQFFKNEFQYATH